MADYTPELNLIKPAQTDFVNIDELNGNSDILDTTVGNHVGKGGSTHPVATNLQAGFMPPELFEKLNSLPNAKAAKIHVYSTLYQGVLPSVAPQYGTLDVITSPTLHLSFIVGSSERENAYIKTIMYEFNAISLNNTAKTLFVYDSDNVTTAFVNDVKIATQINTNQVGEIPLGNWAVGTTRNIKVVVDNRNGWMLTSTIGNLKNCGVV